MNIPELPEYEISPSLDSYSFHIRHGFFGRQGGVSEAPYATLNVSRQSDDKPEHVSRNRELLLEALGVDGELVMPMQAHSSRALLIDQPGEKQADALVTNRPGLILGVACADCAPILLCDPVAGIVAAIHAGWRGSLGRVVEAALDLMLECKANTSHCIAAIGPVLGPESFEVGPELVEKFAKSFPWSENLFAPTNTDRYLFDHPSFIRGKLTRAGISLVEILPIDTMTRSETYFSYRNARQNGQEQYGRNASVIALLE